MPVELTEKRLRNVEPASRGKRVTLWDSVVPGLGARVTDRALITFIVMRRIAGEKAPRRMTLGRYPALGLAEARRKARSILELVAEGKDPRQEIARQRAAEERRRAETFEQVADLFIARHASQRRWPEFERVLRRDVIPAWKHRPISDIGRRDVTALLDGIIDRGAPVQANRTLVVVRKLFNWALDRGLIEQTPIARLSMPTKERPATGRSTTTRSGPSGPPRATLAGHSGRSSACC